MIEWAGFLKRWSLTNVAISLLNGTRPLLILFSQFLIMSRPFFGSKDASHKLQTFIDLLEDDQVSRDFAVYLQTEGKTP